MAKSGLPVAVPVLASGRVTKKGDREEMIEDKATEKWKERAKKLGLIVNMGAEKPGPKTKNSGPKDKAAGKPDRKGAKK